MNAASIPAIIMSAISFYVGCYHLLNYLRQKKQREDLSFGLLCLSMAFYAGFCAALYSSESVAQGVIWQRAQFFSLSVFTLAFLWFGTNYTHEKPTITTYGFTVAYIAILLIYFFDRSDLTLIVDHPSIKVVPLPFGGTLTYYEAEPGPFVFVQTMLGFIVSFYVMFLIVRYYRRGHQREALPLLAAMVLVFAAAFSDSAVAFGLYQFIYLIEYGYMAIILIMALSLSSTVVQATQTKSALYESEERFRSLVETTSDWVWEINQDGVYTYASPKCREYLGYEPHELVGTTPFDLMPPWEADRLRPELDRLVSIRAPIDSLENTVIHKNGGYVVLETSGMPVFGTNGNFLGYRGIDRDITTRKRAEEERNALQEQLQQAVKMEAIGRLAGGIAHDFNNLLTAIIGNIDLARMSIDSPDHVVKYLDGISMASDSAAALTRQLLSFSRKQIIEPKVVAINDLITNLQIMLVRLLGEDVELEALLHGDVGCVRVDPGQLEQVLVNLAVNARDAMPQGGKLVIETSNIDFDTVFSAHHTQLAAGNYVLLSVSDTGSGMSEEVSRHVFEPFFTTKSTGHGTGLGLATIFGIVKQSGGAIDFYTVEGKGTTFKIFFPRINETPEKLYKKRHEEREIPKGNETIMVVEDNEGVRVPTVMELERLGYIVLSAPTVSEVIDRAKKYKSRIDLLLTDVVMPGMNGRDLADRLCALHPEIKVLFTSGYTENIIVRHGVLEKNIHFISKPYSMMAMARKIREVLESAE